MILVRLSTPPADERLGGDAGGGELASRRQCHRLASRLEVNPPSLSFGAATIGLGARFSSMNLLSNVSLQ